jgi:hypothetical protein
MNPLSSKNFGYIHVSMLLDPIFLLSSFLALYSNKIIHNGGTYAIWDPKACNMTT